MRLHELFEAALWNTRFVVLAAVVSTVLVAIAMFYIVSVEAVYTVGHLLDYASPALDAAARAELRERSVGHVIEIVDGFLLGAVLLIFGLGLYELFISQIDIAEESEGSNNVLNITSLDDLKTRLAKVILIILIVKFFEYVTHIEFDTPLQLLQLAGGIALIGLALYLTHASESAGAHTGTGSAHE
jgi:uncharacterized membrane protein YqhA